MRGEGEGVDFSGFWRLLARLDAMARLGFAVACAVRLWANRREEKGDFFPKEKFIFLFFGCTQVLCPSQQSEAKSFFLLKIPVPSIVAGSGNYGTQRQQIKT